MHGQGDARACGAGWGRVGQGGAKREGSGGGTVEGANGALMIGPFCAVDTREKEIYVKCTCSFLKIVRICPWRGMHVRSVA